MEAIVEHKVEDLVNRLEGLIGYGAGLGEQDVVGGPVRRECGLGFDHVVEESDGVVDGGDCGVGLEEGVVDAKIERGFCCCGDGVEDSFGV